MDKKKGLDGFTLKMIALVTMLIDHTGASILYRELSFFNLGYENVFITAENFQTWNVIYMCMRGLGRMAFPIYCFLLVEGFGYTRSVKNYAKRLLGFAFLSEIPFDMVLFPDFWKILSLTDSGQQKQWLIRMMSYNNVFFTLFFGLVTIWAMKVLNEKLKVSHRNRACYYFTFAAKSILLAGIAAVGMLVAEYAFHTDYGAAGVAAIIALYMLRNYKMVSFGVCVAILTLMSSPIEALALLMLIPIYFYNGTRGKQVKYLFYGFYPVHLLVLGLICFAAGLYFK